MQNLIFEHAFDHLDTTILPSDNSLDLLSTSLETYKTRFGRQQPFLSELYHENSKINSQELKQITYTPSRIKNLKKWFFETAMTPNTEIIDPLQLSKLVYDKQALPDYIQKWFIHIASQVPLELFYNFDLLTCFETYLLRYIPLTHEWFVITDNWPSIENVTQYIPQASLEPKGMLFFAVGSPWRHHVMLGQRGYRHMLIEIGKALNALSLCATHLNLIYHDYPVFLDTPLNTALDLDGIEKYVVSVFSITQRSEDQI